MSLLFEGGSLIQRASLLGMLAAACAWSQKLTSDREASLKADLAGQIDGMKKQGVQGT